MSTIMLGVDGSFSTGPWSTGGVTLLASDNIPASIKDAATFIKRTADGQTAAKPTRQDSESHFK